MTDLELLSSRLQTLENRFRRIAVVAVIVCIAIAALVLVGQAPSPLPRVPLTISHPDELPAGAQARQIGYRHARSSWPKRRHLCPRGGSWRTIRCGRGIQI